MPHATTTPEDDNAPPLTGNAARALRHGSGFFEINVRDGFEDAARLSLANVFSCYRAAAEARADGDETEAWHLIETAERSLDIMREALCRLEGLG